MTDLKISAARSVAAAGQDRLPQRQLLAITHDVKTGGNVWSEPVYIPFIPDTVKIKQIAYLNDGQETGTYLLTCSSLGTPFCVFMDAAINSADIAIDVRNKSINTRWQFQLQNIDGTAATAAEGKIGLILEFIAS